MTAILLDIDGVLHVSGEVIAGAPDAVRALREAGHRVRFVTNNTTRARTQLAEDLRALGVEVDESEVTTTPLAAGKLLQGLRVLPLTMAAVHDDLAQHVTLVEDGAEAVLVGGADETAETGEVFAYENLNRAFAALRAGAFVAGLEYAADSRAEIVGKPTAAYFEAALAELEAAPRDAIMVGDDVEADIGGAKAIGMRGVLVRTGKFRPGTLREADPQPDAVLDSIADLPSWLEEGAA